MEAALGAASWLVGKVLNKLSDDLVAAYMASTELGINAEKIREDLMYTHGLLHAAQGRVDDNNDGLKGLLKELSEKADMAEDALDELLYFMIQDKLDGTHHAASDLGGNLQEKIQHGRNAVRHTIGNWPSYFSRSPTHDGCAAASATVATANSQHNKSKSDSGNSSGHVDKLAFDRVSISTIIKSVIVDIHSKCVLVSDLLKTTSQSSRTGTIVTPKRPDVGSMTMQDILYGRSAIFDNTIEDITGGRYDCETLYVLPIVGPGGIGKTTFTQHLYKDKRIEDRFTVRIWVSMTAEFDMFRLTREIHECIPAARKEEKTNLNQLQMSIADRLKYKRFLIVLDDMWKCDNDFDWNNLLVPFTKGEAKGSMILVTTRFPKIEERVKKATTPINLRGLEPTDFFKFFQACVFGEGILNQQYKDLVDIGREIAHKLKGSPLAAKTVAKILKMDLSWKHWRKVLENNEWKNQTKDGDIIPALKISYDYLPFHLKQCFSYFSLFPQDHTFKAVEVTRFWTAIGIIDPGCNDKNYLEELVDNGFLMHAVDRDLVDQCYVIPDLLHELSQSVSAQQCFNISSFSFSAANIPQSIQHLSITIEDRYDENFKKEMAKLKSRINIKHLRTLMITKKYRRKIDAILRDTFEEIEGLRVLFMVMDSPGCLPKNFSKLIHLRYLKIRSPYSDSTGPTLPSTLPRFYHLIFLDLEDWHGSSSLPEYLSRLVNLRQFIANHELHSNVSEIGKIEHLEELKEFHVKKKSVGFELKEVGRLADLGGELCICNLEKVATKKEANEANLALKKNLNRLNLAWGTGKTTAYPVGVADGFKPHDNLRELIVTDYGGVLDRPGWLCRNITMKHLDSLTLYGVSWDTLPPFEQLPYLKVLRMKNVTRVSLLGPELRFEHLKEVEFDNMESIKEWVVGPDCHLFPMLESIKCKKCPNLLALPFFSEYLVPCTQDLHPRYPSLLKFIIVGCPQLSMPSLPHTSTLTHVEVCGPDWEIAYVHNRLNLVRYNGALAFHNMGKVESITSEEGTNIIWTDLQKLTSVRELCFKGDSSLQSTSLLSNFTSLATLRLVDCKNLTLDGFNPLIAAGNLKILEIYNKKGGRRSIAGELLSEIAGAILLPPAAGSFFRLEILGVDSISSVLIAPICGLLANTLHTLIINCDDRVKNLTEEEENALQLLTSLENLIFRNCPDLQSLPRGLHSLSSLTELKLYGCPQIRSLPKEGIPISLQVLHVDYHFEELKEQIKNLHEGTHQDLVVTDRFDYL